MPDGAVWNKELLLGAITVAWGQEYGMWGPVLLLDTGLTGQDGMGSLKASKFHWLLTLQHSLITVLSALAHGGPGSCCPPRFGAVADVHSPWQHSPASRAAPDLLFHTRGWGLEAVGLFPAVVPETALAASSPLQTRSRNLPPVSNPVLNRPLPDCLFSTSWHPAAAGTVPFCPAIQ